MALLGELYDYVDALEQAAGGLLFTHGVSLPESGDLGDRVRLVLRRPKPERPSPSVDPPLLPPGMSGADD